MTAIARSTDLRGAFVVAAALFFTILAMRLGLGIGLSNARSVQAPVDAGAE